MSKLLDSILSDSNIALATKQVKANKGSGGIDNITIEQIDEYINYSRNFMVGKTKRINNETMYFIQPSNPSFYDLEKASIKDKGITIWKQSRKVNIGDICYMYIASPIKAIKYKCEVVETDIPYEYKSKEVSMTKVMKIKLLKKIENNNINIEFLRSLGIPLLRGPVTISKEIASKIEEMTK